MMISDLHRVSVLSLLVVNGLGAQEIASAKGGRKLSWQDEEHVLDNNLSDQDICEPARQAGVELETLGPSVAHATHFITVEDIRYFFEENFPIRNNIPTINVNLTSKEEILPYAPSIPSIFKLPGGRAFDLIMENNDDPQNFLFPNSFRIKSHLEKLSHQFHMMEMWNRVAMQYKKIKTMNINAAAVCPCLVDVQNNGVLKVFKGTLKEMKTEKIVVEVDRQGRAVLFSTGANLLNKWYGGPRGKRDATQENEERKEEDEWKKHELHDSESWREWKQMMQGKMLPDAEIFNVAMYMFCKIKLLE